MRQNLAKPASQPGIKDLGVVCLEDPREAANRGEKVKKRCSLNRVDGRVSIHKYLARYIHT
jgi:hypothetical protein